MIPAVLTDARGGRLAAAALVCALAGSLAFTQEPPVDPPVGPDEQEPDEQVADEQVADEQELDQQMVELVCAALTPPASGETPQPDKMAAGLVSLGDAAVPVVIAILAGEVDVPPVAHGTLEEPVHSEALAARQQVLRAALARCDGEVVLAHLMERSGPDTPLDVRLFAAGLLGTVDEAGALPALLVLVEGIEPIHLLRSYVQVTLEEALARQLARRPRSLDQVDRIARDAGPELCAVLVRSIGRIRSSQGIEILARQLGRDAALDAVILGEIGRVAGEGGLAVSPGALAEVRRTLSSPEPGVLRAAAAALGRLRDTDAYETLAQLVESSDPLVASAARWSLQRLADEDLGADAAAWLEWRTSERDWWLEEAPALLETLHSDDPGEVYAAVNVLAGHPLQRHDVAEALGPLLVHPVDGVSEGACAALTRLGSSRALPWLLEALASGDAGMRNRARAALSSLTGLDLPAEYVVWSRALSR